MFRSSLSYKFSTFMGYFCIVGIFIFFALQEFANGWAQGIFLYILAGLIVKSDIILIILGLIDFSKRKKLKPAKEISLTRKICEITSIIIYLIISGISWWMVLSIHFYKP